MSNTSNNKTVNKPTKNKDKDKLRVIVGEIGRDSKTGILGRGYSSDNGKTFHVTDTMYGRLYDPNDIEGIWNGGTADKVKKEVDSATAEIPAAVSAANSAVSAAESAVAASKVNSDAIIAQSEAISEAKAAMDSATAEIQQTAANAASDSAKIRADVAQVQNEVDTAKAANSASVEALKSDVSAAKQDLADVHDSLDKAQSAIEQNQKLINDNVAKITSDVSTTKQDLATVHDSLTKAQAAAEQNQKAINDSIAQINANVDATNQDLAGVRKDLTKAQSDITANQKAIDDNVAQISDDITQDRKDIADVRQGLTKAQSDIIANQKAINDNVAQINSDIEQDRKDIASAQQANADTVKQLDTYSKQAQDQGKTIKSIQDKQDGFTATLADVQGNVSQVSDKVDGLSASLKDTQGNVASVKAQADQLSATLTDHAKSIATLTASAKELSSTLEDADGRLSKVEQTAQTNSSTLSDVQGDLSQVKQNATKLVSTLKDAQGNISTLQQKADSVSTQLASAQGDIATLQTGVDSVKATLTSHDKSIHTLQADSKSLKDSMADAQGDISTLRKTATDVTSELEDHTGRLSKVEQTASKQATTLSDLQGNLSQVEQKADSNTATISSINKNAMQDRGVITDTKTSFDSLTQLGTYSIKASGLPKMPEQHYGTLVVSGSAGSGWLSQQFIADTTGNVYTRVFSNNVWSAWKQGGSQDAINQVKQTADSNSATIRNVQGDVSTLKQTATGVEATLADHENNIHTLQADDKSLKDSMTNAQGDISTLQKSATSLDSEMKDHAGRLSKVEQSAATQATTLSDLQGNLTQVKQQADGLVTTLKNAQGSITQIQQKADGTLAQLKSAQGDIASLQTDVTGIKATLTDHEGDIHTLQADSKTLKDDMVDAQGNISSLQKSATDLTSEMSSQDGRLSKVEQTAKEHTSTISDLGKKVDSNGGGVNLLTNSQGPFRPTQVIATQSVSDNYVIYNTSTIDMIQGQTYTVSARTNGVWSGTHDTSVESDKCVLWLTDSANISEIITADTMPHTFTWNYPTKAYYLRVNAYHHGADNPIYAEKVKIERGSVATPYSPAPEDLATVTQVKQTADGIETTLKSAQGDIDQIKQTAKGTSEQLSNVQGDVTNIQKDVSGLKQTTADNAGNIHTLQSDSKTLKDDMQDAQGDIATLKKTSTDVVSELKDHAGRISKTEQTAAEHTTEIADAQGNLSKVSQKADGLEKLVSDAQGDINDVKMTATGMESKITTQENDIAQIKANADQLSTRMSGVETTANNAKSSADSANGKIDGITSSGGGRNLWSGSKAFRSTNINQQTVTWSTGEDGVAVAHMTGNSCGFYGTWAGIYVDGKDPFSVGDKGTFSVEMKGTGTITIGREDNFTQAFNLTDQWQRYSVSGTVKYTNSAHIIYNESGKNVDAYIRLPMVEKGPVAHDWTPAPEDVSAKITANSTEIDQTKKAITLKADQSTVDNLSGEVSQNKAQLKVQADQINSKVSTIDFTALDGRTMQNRGTADSADFNTLTKPGFYTIINPWNGKNYPTDSWGTLEVSGQVSDTSGRLNQKFVSDYGGAIYTRQYNMTTKAWTAWQQSANQSDINSLNGKITSNKTAIDQTNKAISLKADQTEVDQIKNTATQNSSRLNVMANEISSKVTSTDVNNIVNSKGYATTSTVQSLITQKAGTINESITNLTSKVNGNNGGGVNLQVGTADCSFIFSPNGGTAVAEKYDDQTKMIHYSGKGSGFYLDGVGRNFIPEVGETYTFSADIKGKGTTDGGRFNYEGSDTHIMGAVALTDDWKRISNTVHVLHHEGTWVIYVVPDSSGNNDFYVKHIKIERGSVATPWTPAPSDNATVTQVQQITASIDGLQSTVANKADKSQITQLSNVIQSKVSTDDFNNLRKAVDLQTLDSADINNMKTNGHYFVRNLANNPVGGWVYVDVTGNGADRIRQDIYQDNGNQHKYRRWFGDSWTAWSQGATESEITQLRDDINLRVKSGDLLSQINLTAHNTLIQSGKIYLDSSSTVFSGKAFIPSAAIVNLDVAKLNAGTINTDRIHIGDDSVYLSVKNNYLRLDGSNTKDKYQLRLTGNDIEFADNDSSNWEYRIQHGITKYQTDEDGLDFDVYSKRGGANHTVMAVSDAGVMISPSLFFQTDGIDSSNWMGFTRNTVDGNSSVSFHTWDDNNEGFHVDCGARFMNYVYINGYARAQGWLTNSTLSKKTNIAELDTKVALDTIRQDKQYTYEYRQNVERGENDPQASLIIDDVNAVSQYTPPKEFLDRTGKYREPAVELSYLVAAVQELDSQVQQQAKLIKELKEKANE